MEKPGLKGKVGVRTGEEEVGGILGHQRSTGQDPGRKAPWPPACQGREGLVGAGPGTTKEQHSCSPRGSVGRGGEGAWELHDGKRGQHKRRSAPPTGGSWAWNSSRPHAVWDALHTVHLQHYLIQVSHQVCETVVFSPILHIRNLRHTEGR